MNRYIVRRVVLVAAFGLLALFGLDAPAKAPAVRTIDVTAKRFEFSPSVIHVKKNERVVLRLESLDRKHGFNIPDLGLRAEVIPGEATTVELAVPKAGRYAFHCDVFCGEGHEDMTGELIVEDR